MQTTCVLLLAFFGVALVAHTAAAKECEVAPNDYGVEHPPVSLTMTGSQDEFFLQETALDLVLQRSDVKLRGVDFSAVTGASAPFTVWDSGVDFLGNTAVFSGECGVERPAIACLLIERATQIRFAQPIRGLDFFAERIDGQRIENMTISLFDADGTLLDSSGALNHSEFFGVAASVPFSSVVISTSEPISITDLKIDEAATAKHAF